jgi:hypothetical protein
VIGSRFEVSHVNVRIGVQVHIVGTSCKYQDGERPFFSEENVNIEATC